MQDPAADAGIRAGHVKLSHLLILMEHDVDWPADIWREWLGSFANGLLKCSPAYARMSIISFKSSSLTEALQCVQLLALRKRIHLSA